ncbi:hypothetical protein ACSSWA_11910 [Melioribacter sp. Ez-97]|uniref:hypothetical protein n=1 Tax=Melioribacter sp. Ez-97 TaxID=3423434 RepID=UPI003EDB5641
MKSLQKMTLPALGAILFVSIYFSYFAPTDELGDLSKFGASEINQTVNVMIVKENGFGRNAGGRIISFRAKDKNGVAVNVKLSEPAPPEIINAEIVELLGHLHGSDFNAASVKIIK